MSDNDFDRKEIKGKLVNELEDIKMDEKLKWKILGHFKSVGFGKNNAKRFQTKFMVGLTAAMCVVVITTLGMFAYSQSTAFKMYLQNGVDNNKIALGIIPTVDSEEKLVSLLKLNQDFNGIYEYYDEGNNVQRYGIDASNAPKAPILSENVQSTKADNDYSKTNTQVQGVDEGDIVKTDGKFIYRLSNNAEQIGIYYDNFREGVIEPDILRVEPKSSTATNKLSIVEALPDGKLKAISEIKIDKDQRATEFYLDNSTISIIFDGGYRIYNGQSKQISQVLVYGISDITKPNLIKNYQIEGSYLSSRKIDNYLYLITNKYIDNYGGDDITTQMRPPVISDNKEDNSFTDISYKDVQYFPDETYETYVNISAIDVSKPAQDAKVTTYLSSGQNVYASLNNLYIANVKYDFRTMQKDFNTMEIRPGGSQSGESTNVYKFSLDKGNVVYKAKADNIPGRILNQYSMDEHNGFFRIAVTTNSNALHIFDSAMKKTGAVTNMAEGEHIKSVRFMGDKGYVVTFRQTDPLFVIDLSNPSAPKVLGELKIPGFSEYLHPYDENHIIGVGKSATDEGRVDGLKMSMFDVTDPINPKEMFTRDIGEGLFHPINSIGQNPKAFLFDKERGIIALPVSVYQASTATPDGAQTRTSELYMGQSNLINYFHIYNVSLKDGFVLKAKLTASNPSDNSSGYNVENARALYIRDRFYTTTDRVIKSFDYATFNQIDALNIVEQK